MQLAIVFNFLSIYSLYMFQASSAHHPMHMWVPVTTTWRVFRLWMEERPPIWRVAVNKLNKQPWTADEGWSSSLGVGQVANNPSP
jgi:hypothetical protein